MLVFTASEVETASLAAGINPGVAGLLGGMTGGIAQAYATMGECPLPLLSRPKPRNVAPFRVGWVVSADLENSLEHIDGTLYGTPSNDGAILGFTTCMKTAEITRAKTAAAGVKPPSTWAVFMDIYRREGIAGVNKGVNAVAVRQCTNWGSR